MKAIQPVLSTLLVAGFAVIAAAQEEAPSLWKTSAGLNVTVNKGNSDTLLVGANILTAKKWRMNELTAGADAVYGDTKDVNSGVRSTTAQNYGAFTQYNRLLNDRWFLYGRADGRQDRVANVDYRVQLNPGIGYYAIKKEKTILAFETGPGVVFERLRGAPSTEYFTLRVAQRFQHEFNERVRLTQEVEFLPQVDDFNNFVINAQATIEADITKKLSTRLTLQDNYRNVPAVGRKENDIRILAGLAYKFS
jgi:putative salt-induced outer membrane protein